MNPKPEYFNRGYEWWLMKEAKKRNPNIILDCLPWGAPYWIGNGNFYSQDMCDYTIAFVKGAKQYHNLDINLVGSWNERNWDANYLKMLRRSLDQAGLQSVKIVAPDVWDWTDFITAMNGDPELKAAVYAVGNHYSNSGLTVTDIAKDCGKPLWSTEDGPWSGNWLAVRPDKASTLQKLFNLNYINGRMTKTQIWSPVTSYYDNLPINNSGVMKANTPWSGFYQVLPAVWVTAHTTQFTQPGWRYLDGACGLLPGGGSHVALKAPNGSDWSLIIETIDATATQQLSFDLTGNLSTGTVRVWQSNASQQFVRQPDLFPVGGRVTITLEPGSLYSLTTTSGQGKGSVAPPAPQSFPSTYTENFESYDSNKLPRYFADQGGIFEVAARDDGGKCLRQVVPQKGIEWGAHLNPTPETFIGESNWRNYEVSTDVMIEGTGYASLFGRVGGVPQNANPPNGYWLRVDQGGNWQLCMGKTAVVLASGNTTYSAAGWNTLKLGFSGTTIKAYINGAMVANIVDGSYMNGMAGLGCGWHGARFDNFAIHVENGNLTNLALFKPATCSSYWTYFTGDQSFIASRANDGNIASSRWNAASTETAGAWLEIDFGQMVTFDTTYLTPYNARITAYKIQYWNGTQWLDAYSGGVLGTSREDHFTPVTGSKIRLYVVSASGTPSIYEFEVYKTP